jgi:hypothetical protein
MNSMRLSVLFLTFTLLMVSGSCRNRHNVAAQPAETDSIAQPVKFNADSAYYFVKAQCDFGPRVPGTEAHARAVKFLSEQLRASCDSVIMQRAELTTYDGVKLDACNIIGEINPAAKQRILLLAHYDCRPWADNDPDQTKHKEPVMGANDAASGVGVLLEVARAMKAKKSNVGVDILFVDAEDWGNNGGGEDTENTWGLGTQYWVAHPHHDGYRPMYGILLDMVGASGAKFKREYFSVADANDVLSNVWNIAAKSGFSSYFSSESGGAVTDDHVFVNHGGIPCIDIIDMQGGSGQDSGFFSGWHTTHDTIDVIDRATLNAVGQTLLDLIYSY